MRLGILAMLAVDTQKIIEEYYYLNSVVFVDRIMAKHLTNMGVISTMLFLYLVWLITELLYTVSIIKESVKHLFTQSKTNKTGQMNLLIKQLL